VNIETMSAQEFAQARANGSAKVLIDVRTEAEYGACHVDGAALFPLQDLSVAKILLAAEEADAGGPIYVLCKAGGRAKQAASKIAPETLRNVIVVEGGTDACVEAGMPVNRGKEVMSLERQVRITAGSLVFAGALLGWQVDPAFYGLSAFVGAGLVFAGVTDTCAMGMLIARMPWNKA
jgi:rhodanese-related sulfurtransferase